MMVMPELNLDLSAASEKEDVFVEKGPRIAITSDGTTGASGGGEELDSEAGRAERSEGMSHNDRYLRMDGQRVCHSPTIAVSTYVC